MTAIGRSELHVLESCTAGHGPACWVKMEPSPRRAQILATLTEALAAASVDADHSEELSAVSNDPSQPPIACASLTSASKPNDDPPTPSTETCAFSASFDALNLLLTYIVLKNKRSGSLTLLSGLLQSRSPHVSKVFPTPAEMFWSAPGTALMDAERVNRPSKGRFQVQIIRASPVCLHVLVMVVPNFV